MSKTDGVEVNVEMSKKPASMAELLESCGLQHRTRDFESEGYTIEISIDALKAGTLLEDLKELNLPLGERRMFVDQMEQLQKAPSAPRLSKAASVGPVETERSVVPERSVVQESQDAKFHAPWSNMHLPTAHRPPWLHMHLPTAPKDITSASNSLVATHMPLFIIALMHVSTFAVLGMWTTFWPLVWCAVPASLFAMVAAGLIGTSPPNAISETIVYRSGTIKLFAWATVILTTVSFFTACALGGVMVQQAFIWEKDKGIANNCDHDESKNEFRYFGLDPKADPRTGFGLVGGGWVEGMHVLSMRCLDDDDCTGARWCDRDHEAEITFDGQLYWCTGNVGTCDHGHPAIPDPFAVSPPPPSRRLLPLARLRRCTRHTHQGASVAVVRYSHSVAGLHWHCRTGVARPERAAFHSTAGAAAVLVRHAALLLVHWWDRVVAVNRYCWRRLCHSTLAEAADAPCVAATAPPAYRVRSTDRTCPVVVSRLWPSAPLPTPPPSALP